MPQLKPFPALRYDPRVVGGLDSVLCPPYDIIAPAERAALARVEHNAVHLELPVAPAGGDAYAHAAALLDEWLVAGVLRHDERPMIYLLEQSYALPGSDPTGPRRTAHGLFCRLRLEPFGAGVLRHEQTMSAPKEDRFKLLRATRTNLSPVLMLYRGGGAGATSAELIARLTEPPPDVEASASGVDHRLWALDPQRSTDAAALLELAAGGPLAIADGHHRYETALRFRDEVGGEGADEILVLLYDAEQGGLSVLPTHRLLRGLGELEALSAGLAELFEVEHHAQPTSLLRAVEEREGAIGMWSRSGGLLLGARRPALASLLAASSAALRELDVSALAAALQHALGLSPAALHDEGRLAYTKDVGEALAAVDSRAADACFLLRATPVQAVLDIAQAGELMPPKSTYFVPKAATGLVFNRLAAQES